MSKSHLPQPEKTEKSEINCNWGRLLWSDEVFSHSSGSNPKQGERRMVDMRWQCCPLSGEKSFVEHNKYLASNHFALGWMDICMQDSCVGAIKSKILLVKTIALVIIKVPINNCCNCSIALSHIMPESTWSTRSKPSHVGWTNSCPHLILTLSSAVIAWHAWPAKYPNLQVRSILFIYFSQSNLGHFQMWS